MQQLNSPRLQLILLYVWKAIMVGATNVLSGHKLTSRQTDQPPQTRPLPTGSCCAEALVAVMRTAGSRSQEKVKRRGVLFIACPDLLQWANGGSNLASRSGSSVKACGRTFSATSRSSLVSLARYTSPYSCAAWKTVQQENGGTRTASATNQLRPPQQRLGMDVRAETARFGPTSHTQMSSECDTQDSTIGLA